jgi:hypothetical protein
MSDRAAVPAPPATDALPAAAAFAASSGGGSESGGGGGGSSSGKFGGGHGGGSGLGGSIPNLRPGHLGAVTAAAPAASGSNTAHLFVFTNDKAGMQGLPKERINQIMYGLGGVPHALCTSPSFN